MPKSIPEGLTQQHVLVEAKAVGAKSGFITSRGFALPTDAAEMGKNLWFNMWQRRLWPYKELDEGDTLYWYDTKEQAIVWRSRVVQVERFEYANKDDVRKRFQASFGLDDLNDAYFDKSKDQGYCLAYKVDSLARLDVPKPAEFKFPMEGWLRCSDDDAGNASPDGPSTAELSKTTTQFAVITENDESAWNDETGIRYHFPKRYLKLLPAGTKVLYYKGKRRDESFATTRLSAEPHYFGLATIGEVSPDSTSTKSDFYATIEGYTPFASAVPSKSNDGFLEVIPPSRVKNYWRDGVRGISEDDYERIVYAAVSSNAVSIAPQFSPLPTEESFPAKFVEGATRLVSVNAYERNLKARKACLNHYGFDCSVCGFNFAEEYGDIGEGFIHVHHLKDLATVGGEYEVDPIKDLRPVCPNCHAMLHVETPAMSIERLRSLISAKR